MSERYRLFPFGLIARHVSYSLSHFPLLIPIYIIQPSQMASRPLSLFLSFFALIRFINCQIQFLTLA